MKKLVQAILALLLVAGIVGLAMIYLPWKEAIGGKLQAILAAKGFENVRLTLSDIGFHEAMLDNISLGSEESPLTLKNITVRYSPFELWDGHLQELTITGVFLDVRQQDGQWAIQGFGNQTGQKSTIPALPLDEAAIEAIPVGHLRVEDSQLRIDAGKWDLTVPLRMEWRKNPAPEILLHAENLKLETEKFSANVAQGSLEAKPAGQKDGWSGVWHLRDIMAKGGPAAWPVMNGTGIVTAAANTVMVNGDIKSADNAYFMEFNLDYKITNPQKAEFTLLRGTMPWQEGTLTVENVAIPLLSQQPVKLVLQIDQVSIGQLMAAMTGKRVTATGLASGDLPLTIGRDGSMSFGQGTLKAIGPGIISLPPDIIPGDNEQVAITREILNNFHYNGLSVALSSNGQNSLSLLVTLEGNNPDMYEGRPVKLNVQLNGDVLDFVRQNVMFITDPETLLQQGEK